MKEIICLLLKEKKSFFFLLFTTLLSIGVSFSIPILNMVLIDEVLLNNRFDLIYIVVFSYIFLAFLNVGLYMLNPRLSTYINEKIILDLRLNLTKGIQIDEKKLFSSSDKGDLLNIYNHDIPVIASLVIRTVKSFIEQGLTLIATLTILFYFDYRVAILALIIMPFYIGVPMLFKKQVKESTNKVQEKNSEINGIIQEGLNGLQQIKIFNKQKHFLNRSEIIFKSIIDLRLKQTFYQNAATATLVIYWISILLVFWIGGNQVVSGTLTIGSLLAIVNYMDKVEWLITRLSSIITEYNTGQVSLKRYSRYSEVRGKIENEKSNIEELDQVQKLEIINVSFKYPNNKIDVLKNINLTLHKGDCLGIIGSSGSGKTTLINLLFRFYQPSTGEIRINDKFIEEYSINSFRDKIAYMSQDNFLFEVSILENIAFGSREEVSREEIITAAKMAGAHDFIEKLPNQYDSIYGKKGLDLSTGQKQRIALSRIFLKNPEIIILDEPTSNLDDDTTALIFESMLNYAIKDRILIVVSHDKTSLIDFKHIIKLE